MGLARLVSLLARSLDCDGFDDRAHNGLQVEGRSVVRRLCTAVDASQAAIDAAASLGADALLVHHGLLWGEARPLSGRLGRLVRALHRAQLSLLAYHLPLDAHPRLGNNAGLARLLGLRRRAPFGLYRGRTLGFAGALPGPLPLGAVTARLARTLGHPARLLGAADPTARVRRVAVVSGRLGSEDVLAEAGAAGVELYVTGEVVHEVGLAAAELGLALIAAGHYATETLGVRALGDHLARRFGLAVTHLDLPSGL